MKYFKKIVTTQVILLTGALLAADPETTSTTTKRVLENFKNEQEFLSFPALNHLAPPTSPPASLTLLETVADDTQWRGVQCGIAEPSEMVFRDSETWKIFWGRAMAPYSYKLKKIPEIDFSKEMVVGVFLGEMAYPVMEVKITALKKMGSPTGKNLSVQYIVIEHLRGIATPRFPVHPFHLQKIPVFDGVVLFKKES